MANRRMISKSISTSEKVNRKLVQYLKEQKFKDPSFGPLLYTWLHPHADDFGRMDGSAYWIKYNIVPCLEFDEKKIEQVLHSMESIGLIIRYSVNGTYCLQIQKFEEHQTGLNKRTASKFPDPPDDILRNSEKFQEIPPRREGKGRGREGEHEVELEQKRKKDIMSGKIIEEIVLFLNKTLGTGYKPTTQKTRECIKARLNEGFAVDDFKVVITKKAKQWGNDPKMAEYLRPITLFGTKFESYLNQITPKEKTELQKLYEKTMERYGGQDDSAGF